MSFKNASGALAEALFVSLLRIVRSTDCGFRRGLPAGLFYRIAYDSLILISQKRRFFIETLGGPFMEVIDTKNVVTQWIRGYLSAAYARGISDLLVNSRFPGTEIQSALRQLLASSEVEALTPVGARCKAGEGFPPGTFFRMVRETDTAYRWQTHVFESVLSDRDWSRYSFVTRGEGRRRYEGSWFDARLPASA
jgi:hypothetical protein